MEYQTIHDIKIKDKIVLVRVDYNVPIENGKITNDLRIRASMPTIEYLRENGAKKIVLISHLGRPEGRDKKLSLKPVAERLNELIGDVDFANDVSGPDVEDKLKKLKKGGVLLLENLRFYSGEEKNSSEFIREIIDSVGATIYIQDGFAVVHRAHASTSAVSEHLPVYAGLLVEKEIEELEKAIKNPARPLVIIIGGAKIEDKQPLIDKFLSKADKIIVSGKIAADGYKTDNEKIYVVDDFDEDSDGNKLDTGPLSTVKIAEILKDAKTVVWNGLTGKAEDLAYSTSSTVIAEILGESEDKETIICGGDTAGFVENLTEDHKNLKYSLISTGGGAALEFLIGKKLPGLEALERK